MNSRESRRGTKSHKVVLHEAVLHNEPHVKSCCDIPVKLIGYKVGDRKKGTQSFNLHIRPFISTHETYHKASLTYCMSRTNSVRPFRLLQSTTRSSPIHHLSTHVLGKESRTGPITSFLSLKDARTCTKTRKLPLCLA